jgi:uncharacterized Zn-binding protein involved in type VI secretion
MTRPFVVLGDTTDHGGAVITAAGTSDIGGQAIACVGDKVRCPRHGITTITSGDSTVVIDGRPVARHGDKTECGATLVAAQAVSGSI